jgi:hypothetical protein
LEQFFSKSNISTSGLKTLFLDPILVLVKKSEIKSNFLTFSIHTDYKILMEEILIRLVFPHFNMSEIIQSFDLSKPVQSILEFLVSKFPNQFFASALLILSSPNSSYTTLSPDIIVSNHKLTSKHIIIVYPEIIELRFLLQIQNSQVQL